MNMFYDRNELDVDSEDEEGEGWIPFAHQKDTASPQNTDAGTVSTTERGRLGQPKEYCLASPLKQAEGVCNGSTKNNAWAYGTGRRWWHRSRVARSWGTSIRTSQQRSSTGAAGVLRRDPQYGGWMHAPHGDFQKLVILGPWRFWRCWALGSSNSISRYVTAADHGTPKKNRDCQLILNDSSGRIFHEYVCRMWQKGKTMEEGILSNTDTTFQEHHREISPSVCWTLITNSKCADRVRQKRGNTSGDTMPISRERGRGIRWLNLNSKLSVWRDHAGARMCELLRAYGDGWDRGQRQGWLLGAGSTKLREAWYRFD